MTDLSQSQRRATLCCLQGNNLEVQPNLLLSFVHDVHYNNRGVFAGADV